MGVDVGAASTLIQSTPGALAAIVLYYKVIADIRPELVRLEERYNALKERVERLGTCVSCFAEATEQEAEEEKHKKRKERLDIDTMIASIAVGILVVNVYIAIAAIYTAFTHKLSIDIASTFTAISLIEAWLANTASNLALKGRRAQALLHLLASSILITVMAIAAMTR